MLLDHQINAGYSFKCADFPVTTDPYFDKLAFWLNGNTITNGTKPLPRDLTLANTYTAHSARWNNPATTLSQSPQNPYKCYSEGTSLNVPSTSTTALYSSTISSLSLQSNNFTIEFWARPTPASNATLPRILDKGGIGGAGGVLGEFFILGSDGTTAGYPVTGWYLSGQTLTETINPDLNNQSSWFGKFEYSKWTFISITRDSDYWFMHQDGNLLKTLYQTGSLYSSSRGVAVGCGFTSSWASTSLRNRYNGQLRDVKVYNGIAKYSNGQYRVPPVPNII